MDKNAITFAGTSQIEILTWWTSWKTIIINPDKIMYVLMIIHPIFYWKTENVNLILALEEKSQDQESQ